MKKYVYSFGGGTADGDGKMKDTLGGKGAGLAEMSRAGVPVPPGLHHLHRGLQHLLREQQQGSRRRSTSRCAKRLAHPRRAHGPEARRRDEPAAGQRPLRREVLHARHDGHHPEPRPERQDRRRPGRQERQPALRLRLLPPLHPDVRQRRARDPEGRVRARLRRPQEEGEGASSTPT